MIFEPGDEIYVLVRGYDGRRWRVDTVSEHGHPVLGTDSDSGVQHRLSLFSRNNFRLCMIEDLRRACTR